MQNKHSSVLVALIAFVLLFLISCMPSARLADTPVVPTEIIAPTDTVTIKLPTQTNVVSPTITAMPPTEAPIPVLDGKIAFWDSDIKIFVPGSREVQTIFKYEQEVNGIKISPLFSKIAWSPDGHWVAFTAEDVRANEWIYAYHDIYVAKIDGSQIKRLTFSPSHAKGSISWSPDGKYILMGMDGQTGIQDLYLIDAKSGEIEHRLTVSIGVSKHGGVWSPNGKTIAFVSLNSLYMMDSNGKNQYLIKDFSPNIPMDLSWSPDGSIIAINVGDELNPTFSNLFTIRTDGTDLKQLTDTSHLKNSPSWSPDGKYIIFSNAPYTKGEPTTKWDINVVDLFGHEETLLSSVYVDATTVWSPVPALKIGNNYAITELSDNLNLHLSTSLASKVINKLKIGEIFTVLDGPVDTKDYYWWQIRTSDGAEGWIVEMAYWYKPLNP